MRRAIRYCLAALLAAAVALAWALWTERDPVQEKFAGVQIGWTRAEVEYVMGKDAETMMNSEDIHLYYSGKSGAGHVVISRLTERVEDLNWIPSDREPIWLRLWH